MCAESKMAASMDKFKGKGINFVLDWPQQNGFDRLKKVFEGKKNFFPEILFQVFISLFFLGGGV
jgi:hypothetical protein